MVDLSDADLFKTNLTWVKADRHTLWPAGFEPATARVGVI
jgi:hypothetical protein